MPQDMPPVGGYEAVQYKVGCFSSWFFFYGGLGLRLVLAAFGLV
jgi:hypothetical protein